MTIGKRLLTMAAAFATTVAIAQSRPPGWTSAPPSPPIDRVVVCVDVSGSMGVMKIADIRSGLRSALVTGSGDLTYEISIFSFANGITNVIPFTRRRGDVQPGLDRLVVDRERIGKSVLYDCVGKAAEYLRSTGAGGKRILVVSDGQEDGSQLTANAVLQTVATTPAIAVEGIGYGPTALSAESVLTVLTRSSGGRLLTPTGDSAAAFAVLLNSTVRSGDAPVAPVPSPVISPASGPALHTSKVAVHATTEAKCLQIVYGVAVDTLQEVSATSTVVSGRLGLVSITISCVATGTAQNAIALVTAAGPTAEGTAKAADTVAPKLAAAN